MIRAVEEIAGRLTDASAIAESGDMVLSLKRAWHGPEPVFRGLDGRLGLNLSLSELDRMVRAQGCVRPASRRQRRHRSQSCRVRMCLFGPEHILWNVGEFLDYFMVRKVIAGKDLMRAAGTVTKKLAAWLAEKGYAGAEEAEDASERGGAGDEVEDHFTLTRVECGRVWLEDMLDGRELGPIAVPEVISSRCKVGWTISGVVGRLGKRWQLVEAWNVYPR